MKKFWESIIHLGKLRHEFRGGGAYEEWGHFVSPMSLLPPPPRVAGGG